MNTKFRMPTPAYFKPTNSSLNKSTGLKKYPVSY